MSDNNNNTPTPAVPAEAPKAKSLDQLSGDEARALVEKAKAEGKSVEEVFAASNGKAEPKPAANPVKEAAQEAKRKLKIDNEEVDEDEVFKVYKERKGHQKAANQILQEGKAARKQAEQFIAMMKDQQQLFDVIKKLGHDPRQLAEKYLASQLQDDMMDPRDKELRDAKAKLKAIEDMEQKQREAVQAQRDAEVKKQFMKEYETTFVKALQDSQLPATKPMVAEMAKYIARSAKIGFKMTPDEAAKLVKEDILLAHQRLIGDSDGETLMKLLGEDVANKIRKYDTAKIKTPEQVLRVPQEQKPREERIDRSQPKQRMTPQEWRRHKLGRK